MVEDRFTNILHRYWGYPDFRGIQRDIIESVAAGRDTLGLMPTGGGKSLTFQVPAMGADGVLIGEALMRAKDKGAMLAALREAAS